MTLIPALLVTVGATALAVAGMLLIRRHSPRGGWFSDGDRAAGVFGVLATGFAITVGFVVFLAFESFDLTRAGAETEAVVVAQQMETAALLPGPTTPALQGALVCYARHVVGQEWPALRSGGTAPDVNPWGAALFRGLRDVEATTPLHSAALQQWLAQTADRERGRQDRLHAAEGVIPTPLWIVLLVGAGLIVAFMLFFADPGERAAIQGLQIGSVVALLCLTLSVIGFLDRPLAAGSGGLTPRAMERALAIMTEELRISGDRVPPPCDEAGRPRPA